MFASDKNRVIKNNLHKFRKRRKRTFVCRPQAWLARSFMAHTWNSLNIDAKNLTENLCEI